MNSLCLFCALVTISQAGNEPNAQPKTAPTENPAATLAAEHLEAVLAWQMEYRRSSKEERQAVLAQRPSSADYFIRFQKLAAQYPETPVEASALAWMARNAPEETDRSKSIVAIVDRHPDSEYVTDVICSLSDFGAPSATTEMQFEKLLDRSGSKHVQGAAIYGLIRLYEKAQKLSTKLESGSPEVSRLKGADLEYVRDFSMETSRMEELFSRLAKDHRDTVVKVMGRATSLGEFADKGLYAIRNLSIGSIAPDIVGRDLKGVDFKLSDYKGKVVMLSFSGNWCVPCRKLYPHERSLVEKLADKPFALIGVNSDEDLELALKAVDDLDVNWRCFWNGKKGTSGPIAKQWQVSSWPTIFLLDSEGRIRFKSNGSQELDATITSLLGEMGHEVHLSEEASQ